MPKIVIASILKTVHDVRMYEKIALTLTQKSQNDIHIIGFKSQKQNIFNHQIRFYPVFDFQRLSLKRFFSSIVFLKLLFKIRPQIIVVCTHELLIPSLLYKFIFKSKLVYDVRENYCKNIIYNQSFSTLLKYSIVFWVRLNEFIASYFISKFILAERCYLNELKSFLSEKRTIILENKFAGVICSKFPFKIPKGFKMIYTGTIAQLYGIEESIQLATLLHQIDNEVSLEIIGFCADSNYLLKIQNSIREKPFIKLVGGDFVVPHDQIIDALKSADIALLSYRKNESTFDKIPTKLYECLSLCVPMIIGNYASKWINMTSLYNASITIDYMNINAKEIYLEIINKIFYTSSPDETMYKWQSDELLTIFENLD